MSNDMAINNISSKTNFEKVEKKIQYDFYKKKKHVTN